MLNRGSMSRLLASLAAILLCATSLAPATAEACSRIALGSVSGFDVLPADGATVPRSARIWVHLESTRVRSAGDGALRLLDAQGAVVATTQSSIAVEGEVAETVVVLAPSAPLASGQTYEVQSGVTRLVRFTTTSELDTTGPDAPVGTVTEVVGGDSGVGYRCSSASRVEVSLAPAQELAFLVSPGEPAALPAQSLGAGAGSAVTAQGLAPGTRTFRVLAFDLSGNAALGAEVLSATVPPSTAGCSTAAGGPALLLALAALRRRRRAQGG